VADEWIPVIATIVARKSMSGHPKRTHHHAKAMTVGGLIRHYLIQVFCFFAKFPELQLTEAARAQFLLKTSEITDFEPAATLLWTSKAGPEGHEEPQWYFALYNIATRPYGRVKKIQGIPFVFVQANVYERLDGATVDIRDGRLIVCEREK
jgi:hypothetical protein